MPRRRSRGPRGPDRLGCRDCPSRSSIRLPERFFFLRGGAGGARSAGPSARCRDTDLSREPLGAFLAGAAWRAAVRRQTVALVACSRSRFSIMSPATRSPARWSQRPEPPPDDRLLHDRPQVRGDPVDEQAGRELPHEVHEEERQPHEDQRCGPVRRRRHEQRRDAAVTRRRATINTTSTAARGPVRQIRDEQELRARRRRRRARVRRARRVDRPGRCRLRSLRSM